MQLLACIIRVITGARFLRRNFDFRDLLVENHFDIQKMAPVTLSAKRFPAGGCQLHLGSSYGSKALGCAQTPFGRLLLTQAGTQAGTQAVR